MAEFVGAETEGVDWEAVTDELFLEIDRLAHELGEFLAEFRRPDILVLLDEIHEEIAEDLDVIGLITQGIAEHLADARELVLAVER